MTAQLVPGTAFRRSRLAIFAVFFMEAFVLGNWIARIPDVKTLYDFSEGELGLVLFVFAFGTLIAFMVGGSIAKRLGLRQSCALAGAGYAIGNFFLPLAPNLPVLGAVLIFGGLSIGLLEIAMNTAADRLEKSSGRRLMSSAHGSWSLGTLAGALIGGAVAQAGIGVISHFATIMPVAAAVAFIVAQGVPAEPAGRRQGISDGPAFRLPHKSILLLCLLPVGIMLVEGAFIDWSALFVRTVLDGSPFVSGLIYATFALVMAATRFSGDALLARFGAPRVAQVSGVSTAIGITLFALSPNIGVAYVGALLSGLGVAIMYPLTMSAAAARPGDAEDNVAALSLVAFTSFMIAPPIIGFLAEGFGLSIALVLLAPLAASSLLLNSELKEGYHDGSGD